MGLFDFLNPEKRRTQKTMRILKNLLESRFPKGDKDINAAANELLYILNNRISLDEAQEIVRLSTGISRISRDFTKERLRRHLAGYCLHHFTDSQVKEFHRYLNVLNDAMMIHGRSPSEIRRMGDLYVW
ncbi:hypothetical protein [uncultured Eudoraea sp.]|uniref:hypothetical protein n=1 Tax=uncultured Eudoraea sp. TaxID=1035614 RepID=UPI0026244607|nr:hypothetical protein [uncultured Eudoraea sp.]